MFFICDETKSETQRHAVTMAPKDWEFGKCSEPQKFDVFGRRIDLKLKKPEGFFFQKGNTENYQSRNLNNN